MTLLLTVPQRIALMLKDAHPTINKASAGFQIEYDPDLDLPAWEVDDGGGTYDNGAASQNFQPEETYVATLIVAKFGQGTIDERTFINSNQTLAREIMFSTVRYFLARPDLVFSNGRGLEESSLPALLGVKYVKISRDPTTVYGSDDSFGKFYGGKLTFTVKEELIIKRIMT